MKSELVLFVSCIVVLFIKTSKENQTESLFIERPLQSLANKGGLLDGFRQSAHENMTLNCPEFDAKIPEGIYLSNRCQCTEDEATFSFFEKKWQCIENEDFREHEDCGLYFTEESNEDPVRILTEGERQVITLPGANCSINTTSSSYLDCGIWRQIDEVSLIKKLSLIQRNWNVHVLKVNDSNSSPFLNGRVIKLGLTCQPPSGKPCLLFKLKGTVSCRFHQKDLSQVIFSQAQTVTIPSNKQPVIPSTPSFKATQIVHFPTTALSKGNAGIPTKQKLTVFPRTASTKVFGNVGLCYDKLTTLQSHTLSSHGFARLLTNTVVTSYSVSAMASAGTNDTSDNANRNAKETSTPKPRPVTMARILLQGVIPGIIAGVLLVLLVVMLMYLAKKMRNIRVGADRNAEGNDHSLSEEATYHVSETENVSSYELVERRNGANVNVLNRNSAVTNPIYQRDEQIFLHACVSEPHKTEVIYDEPFACSPGRVEGSTALTCTAETTPAENASGYRDLSAESSEQAVYASRYSVPKLLIREPQSEVTERDPDEVLHSSGPPASKTEDVPNKERKERYMLRDILVQDMEIGCLENTDHLLEDMSICPSVLICENSVAKTGSCQNDQSENSTGEHFKGTSPRSETFQPQEQNTKPAQRWSCMEQEESMNSELRPKQKLKAFFKMSL
ncbi:uncharacterized protein [Montipora foliosa]|uniref:uncharacterized protein isoform X1 n=2 Tax=Montipora foliosa TaxID=591990 RepID=UPI0035F19B49